MSPSSPRRLLAAAAIFSLARAAPLPTDDTLSVTPSASSSPSSSPASTSSSIATSSSSSTTITSLSSTLASITTSSSSSPSPSQSANYLLLEWAVPSSSPSDPNPSGLTLQEVDPLLVSPGAITETITLPYYPSSTPAPTPTTTPLKSWSNPPNFSDMSTFTVTAYAAGASNLAILQGSPASNTTTNPNSNSDPNTQSINPSPNSDNTTLLSSSSSFNNVSMNEPWWNPSTNALQILYPQGSINPGNKPQGGSEFYAKPLDLTGATNTSLQYSVYFPPDFDFVKGGKLPGLYGGHKGCSGGNAAVDCFSTRMMWRAGGKGELYLYAPKDKQTPSLCSTPPQSICNADYGLSIGRGAFTFARGDWTTIRQDVWLNTPGQNDGGFNIWVNGNLVITASDVRLRETSNSCAVGVEGGEGDVGAASIQAAVDEDWQGQEDVGVMNAAAGISGGSTSAGSSSSGQALEGLPTMTASSMGYAAEAISAVTASSTGFAAEAISTVTASSTGYDAEAMSAVTGAITGYAAEAVVSGFTAVTASITAPLSAITASPTDIPMGSAILSAITGGFTSSASLTLPSSIPNDYARRHFRPIRRQDVSSAVDPTFTDAVNHYGRPAAAPVVVQAPIIKVVPGQPPASISATAPQPGCAVGFVGMFFSTFFGGHTSDWASPRDQYSYFKDFQMWVNN